MPVEGEARSPSTPEVARRVGAFTAGCLLVSNAVGSGIFTTTGFMARDLGSPELILLLWVVGGLLALAGAMSYSELGAALPRVGGEYVYLRRAYGPLPAFLSGWTSFTMGFGAAIAVGAMAFAEYLSGLLPDSVAPGSPTVLALALVWALTAVHGLGVEYGGWVQRWLTVIKIGAVALLVLVGLAVGQGDWGHLTVSAPGAEPTMAAAAVSLVFVLYSYAGWNAAGYIAGEIDDPGRNLPRAMLGGTLLVMALYVAVNLVYFYVLSAAQLAAEPVLPVGEKVATALLGESGAGIVGLILCFSIAGSVSSMIWAGPRVYFAMANDGALPPFLSRVTRAGTPLNAIVLQSVWVTLLILTGSFEQLVVYSGVALAIFSAAAVSAVFMLRKNEPDLPRPYRVSLYPWAPLAFLAASLLIAGYALFARPVESMLSLLTVAAGAALYFWWRR